MRPRYAASASGAAIAAASMASTRASRAALPASWARLASSAFLYFKLHREEFDARYHQRSNIESTFSIVKAKFGDSVRSKTDVAMGNEVLAKVVCHNICCLISAMYELGITPEFAQAV